MAYEYNAIGDLLNTYLYSADSGNTFAQKLRYHYNIRGWLTDLNSFEDPGYDLFTLKLAYETPNTTLSCARCIRLWQHRGVISPTIATNFCMRITN